MVKLSIFKVSFSNLPILLNIIILVFFSLIDNPTCLNISLIYVNYKLVLVQFQFQIRLINHLHT